MLDRLFFPALGLAAALVVGLALVWPQGLGARSPGPFGHDPVLQSPEMQAAMKRQTEASQERINRARETMRELQARTVPNGS
ncbi:MAG: hypothetical protein AB1760_07470 [Pseudomonadota bacterium]|jgi:hypothetical protein|nr:hypothetical protein [Caulobacteraceae bacterium]MDX5331203.1 hypothetical protein [Caulobacteraceae bacterium]